MKMKKLFMLLAVAGFFSMTTISCGENKQKETKTSDHEGHDHDDHEGHDH
jgi:hypothetical protein